MPLLIAAALVGTAAAQDAVFRTNVNLVRLLTTVKDHEGAPAMELDKSNFKVYDNGVEQQIMVFERHTSQPLSVAILISLVVSLTATPMMCAAPSSL